LAEIAWRNNVLNVLERSEKQLQVITALLKQPAPSPIPPFFGQTRLNAPTPVSVTTEPSFSYVDGTPAKALIDSDRHVQADVLTMPPVSVSVSEKGFSNAADTPTRALVDADRHVQVDVLSGTVSVSTLPPVTQASIRRVLQYPEGTDIDPRQIRTLTANDVVTVANPNVSVNNFPTDYAKEAKQILIDANGHGQIDVLTLPSLPAGVNKIGSVDVASLPSLPAGTNTIGSVNSIKSGTWNIDNLLNPHPVKLTPEDRIQDSGQWSGTFSPTAAGSTTIISGVSGKVIRVYGFSLWNSGSADVTVELYFGTSGKRLFKGLLAPKTGPLKTYLPPWESNAGDSLVLALSAAGTCDYSIGAVQA